MEWGVSGPNLRACGLAWDLRKKRPYSGYEDFRFEVPTHPEGLLRPLPGAHRGDAPEPAHHRQAADHMPGGRTISDDYRYWFRREDMLHDIESLIHHFINVTRGPKIPRGEAYAACEIPRGEQGYYVVSDGLGYPYRMRIRGPGFANVQAMPLMAVGENHRGSDRHLGSLDYILPDIDR
jgi:NADH:ubiquinone oxidoreductase subunit D